MADRIDGLLLKAAEAFEDGRAPFSTDWLADNNVTLDECYTLSSRIAIILKGYLNSPQTSKTTILLAGAGHGIPGMDQGMTRYVQAELEKQEVMKRLQSRK